MINTSTNNSNTNLATINPSISVKGYDNDGVCVVRNNHLAAGDIRWVEATGQEVGNEEQKTRPYLLIRKFGYSGLWLAAPLTPGYNTRSGRDHKEWYRTDASGRDSVIQLGGLRTVDSQRIGLCLEGRIDQSEFLEVKARIRALDDEVCYEEQDPMTEKLMWLRRYLNQKSEENDMQQCG